MGRYQPFTIMRSAALAAVAVAGIAAGASVTRPDALLEEMVGFTGQVLFIDAGARGHHRRRGDGDVAVAGFGERAGPGGSAPDGDTILRIGSITKAFGPRAKSPVQGYSRRTSPVRLDERHGLHAWR